MGQFLKNNFLLLFITISFTSVSPHTAHATESSCPPESQIVTALSSYQGEGASTIKTYLQSPEGLKHLEAATRTNCLSVTMHFAEQFKNQELNFKSFPLTDGENITGRFFRILNEQGVLISSFTLSRDQLVLSPLQSPHSPILSSHCQPLSPSVFGNVIGIDYQSTNFSETHCETTSQRFTPLPVNISDKAISKSGKSSSSSAE